MSKRAAEAAVEDAPSGPSLKITQVKSTIGRPGDQERTIKSLGLRRIRHTVVRPDTPAIRGMVTKVRHLVSVEEIPAGGAEV